MINLDHWRDIAQTLTRHRLRTLLTAFGVFWGIFMLVLLLGAGRGLENGVTTRFGGIENVVFIWSAYPTQRSLAGLAVGRRITLSEADVDAINARAEGLRRVYGINRVGSWGSAQYVTRGAQSGSFGVKGTHPGLDQVENLQVLNGRYVNALDMQQKRKVAIIGTRVRDVLFRADENPIGASITIYGVPFQVVGVAGSFDPTENANNDLETIYIPNRTLRYAFNQVDRFNNLLLLVAPGADAREVEQQVREILRERHKIHPQDVGVLGSFNGQEEYEKFLGLFAGIRLFSWIVAIGTILAGAVGVGNIMLIVVRERTREIGLRKALGATPRAIVSTIVQESLVLTALSGYFGLAAGVAVLEAISPLFATNDSFRSPEIDFATALLALAVLVLSGLFAAWLPAARAAAVNPIIALQDE